MLRKFFVIDGLFVKKTQNSLILKFQIKCQLWHTGEGVGCDWDLETIKFSLKDNDSSAYNFTFKECIKEGKVYERTIDQQEQKTYTAKVRVRIKIAHFHEKNPTCISIKIC